VLITWQARHVLLRYGDACQVLEPPGLVALFRTRAAVVQHYGHGE
jgi:hypothetical protein